MPPCGSYRSCRVTPARTGTHSVTRSARILLGDILLATELLKQDTVARRIEIIGEAVKRLPQELRAQNPETP